MGSQIVVDGIVFSLTFNLLSKKIKIKKFNYNNSQVFWFTFVKTLKEDIPQPVYFDRRILLIQPKYSPYISPAFSGSRRHYYLYDLFVQVFLLMYFAGMSHHNPKGRLNQLGESVIVRTLVLIQNLRYYIKNSRFGHIPVFVL